MRRALAFLVALAVTSPVIALAETKVNEYGEELNPEVIEQVAPTPTTKAKSRAIEIEEEDVGARRQPTKETKPQVTERAQEPARPQRASGPTSGGRDGRFRAGIVGPGIGVVSDGIGAMMTIGAEGEYFFFEKLSAAFRIEAATKFKSPTILTFVPRARYVFDFDSHPRWSAYAQAGIGLGLTFAGGTHASADIAIPGGGFWWQWTERWSVGADTSLHVFVGNGTAVGFTFGPAVRYLF